MHLESHNFIYLFFLFFKFSFGRSHAAKVGLNSLCSLGVYLALDPPASSAGITGMDSAWDAASLQKNIIPKGNAEGIQYWVYLHLLIKMRYYH